MYNNVLEKRKKVRKMKIGHIVFEICAMHAINLTVNLTVVLTPN